MGFLWAMGTFVGIIMAGVMLVEGGERHSEILTGIGAALLSLAIVSTLIGGCKVGWESALDRIEERAGLVIDRENDWRVGYVPTQTPTSVPLPTATTRWLDGDR